MRYKIKLVIYSLMAIFSGLIARDQITFPHDFHVAEEELECTICHGDVFESTSLEQSLLPTMDICSDCHDTDDECEMCHSEPDDPMPFPVSGREYSHAFHLRRFSDCMTCHSYILSDDGTGDRPIWEDWKCSTCHQSNKPLDHDVVWKNFHGNDVASIGITRCELCHTEVFCDECHSFQKFEPATHPVNFIYQHSFEARSETIECSTCHNIHNDCFRSCFKWSCPPPMVSAGWFLPI